jgi:hypothetical protein
MDDLLEKKTKPVTDVPEDDKPPVDKKGKYIKPRPFAKGGSVSSRADGIAQRGKTRGKMC